MLCIAHRWLAGKLGKVRNLTLTLQDCPKLVVPAHTAVHAAGNSLVQLCFTVEGAAGSPVNVDDLVRPLGGLTKLTVTAKYLVLGTALQRARCLRKLALHADTYEDMWLTNGYRAPAVAGQLLSAFSSSPVSCLPPGLTKFSFGGQLLGDARSAGLPYGLHVASSLQGLALHGRFLYHEDIEVLGQLTALKELHVEG